jgi:PmbA protein
MELDRFLTALREARPDGQGVRDWSLYASEHRRMSLGIKDREAGNAHAPLTITEGGGARYLFVWEDGKISRGALERRQVENEPEATLAQARQAAFEDPDAAHVLGPKPLPEVRMHDEGAAAMARGDSGLLATRLGTVRARIDSGDFRTWSGSFAASEGRARLLTSAGIDAEGSGTSIGWHVSLDGEVGDGFGARAAESDADFESRLDRLVEVATALKQPTERLDGGVRPVLLHPNVVEQYVLGTLLHNLQGSVVANEEGHFRREQFGAAAPELREDLGLRLDPLLPLRSGSYRFTSEGVPAAACTYVERGRLVRPVLDVKYARRLGLEPTPIPHSSDTLFLEAGETLSLGQARSRAVGGVLVMSVLGVHTQDSASGDFSLSAPQTLGIGADGHAGRLRCTISGNLFAALRDESTALVRFEGEHTPGLLLSCHVDPK